jgi:hypothetical protein
MWSLALVWNDLWRAEASDRVEKILGWTWDGLGMGIAAADSAVLGLRV